MPKKKVDIRFVIVFSFVWIGFGIAGLIFAPERLLLAISQIVVGLAHWGYAYWLRKVIKDREE